MVDFFLILIGTYTVVPWIRHMIWEKTFTKNPKPTWHLKMGVSKNNGTPKSSILIGCSIVFTIHFGGFTRIFRNIQIDPGPKGDELNLEFASFFEAPAGIVFPGCYYSTSGLACWLGPGGLDIWDPRK